MDSGTDFPDVKRPGREAITSLCLVRLRMSGSITPWRVQGQIYILSVPDSTAYKAKRSVLMNLQLLEWRGHRVIWEIHVCRHFTGGAEGSQKKLQDVEFPFRKSKVISTENSLVVSPIIYFAICVRLNLS